MLLTTGRELSFQPHNFVMLFANVRWNDGFGKRRLVEPLITTELWLIYYTLLANVSLETEQDSVHMTLMRATIRHFLRAMITALS